MIGFIGLVKIKNYIVMGDMVNLGVWLEGVNKIYGM